jgi:ABC-type dipeptide/oligopeptide/nickel transport system permease subunit
VTAAKAKIVIGCTIILAIVLTAIFAPLVAPHDPYQQQVILRLKPPFWMTGGSLRFPLGTDSYGRDILSRLIFGSRLSILVGVASVVLSMLIGTTAGVLAAMSAARPRRSSCGRSMRRPHSPTCCWPSCSLPRLAAAFST